MKMKNIQRSKAKIHNSEAFSLATNISEVQEKYGDKFYTLDLYHINIISTSKLIISLFFSFFFKLSLFYMTHDVLLKKQSHGRLCSATDILLPI